MAGDGHDEPETGAPGRCRAEATGEHDIHLLVYCLTNLAMATIWLTVALTARVWFPWFVFPGIGWGTAVVVHAWVTAGTSAPRTGSGPRWAGS